VSSPAFMHPGSDLANSRGWFARDRLFLRHAGPPQTKRVDGQGGTVGAVREGAGLQVRPERRVSDHIASP
jgi:hypothetical protein